LKRTLSPNIKGGGQIIRGAEVADCIGEEMKLDQTGFWAEIQLDIIKKYLIRTSTHSYIEFSIN
jgi:hypothetical protein